MTSYFPNLRQSITNQYKLAIKSGIIEFIESEEEELDEEGINFEIKVAESLGKKPKQDKDISTNKKSNPFEAPYVPELFIAQDLVKEDEDDNGQEFVILLNKYCIVPRHFLLVTKDFEAQTSPLTPVQLLAAWKVLEQVGKREKHLAFFNCGSESGASQPHKHIQFIPLANGVAPFDSYIAAHSDPKSPFQLPLPYASFTCLLSPPSEIDRQASYLGNIFMALLDLVVDHLRRLALSKTTSTSPAFPLVQKFSQLSYNVIMTSSYLHIVPRTRENYTLPSGETLSINSLGFAGMLLTKSIETMEEVKKVGVLSILKAVAYPPVALGDSAEIEEL